MESQQVSSKDLPSEAAKETRKLFGVAALTENGSHYGPKKYYIIDYNIKDSSVITSELKLQSDHIWIGGFPRSGTHWTAEMTWLINNNLDFDTAHSVHHKERVGFFHPNNMSNYIENRMQPPIMETYYKIPSTKFFKTHMPLSLLPPKLLETSKMVYVARDPRDVLVSLYHISRDWETSKYQGTIEDVFELFIQDNVPYGPYFENVLEFWNARHNKNLLFLFYEEIVMDLPSVVRRISKFFDKEFTESQYEQLCEYLQFSNMKSSGIFNVNYFIKKDVHLRKGKIGGWQEEFTEDMKTRFEIWMSNKLKDTDISFPSVQLLNFS